MTRSRILLGTVGLAAILVGFSVLTRQPSKPFSDIRSEAVDRGAAYEQ
jgi:hypothetical protein